MPRRGGRGRLGDAAGRTAAEAGVSVGSTWTSARGVGRHSGGPARPWTAATYSRWVGEAAPLPHCGGGRAPTETGVGGAVPAVGRVVTWGRRGGAGRGAPPRRPDAAVRLEHVPDVPTLPQARVARRLRRRRGRAGPTREVSRA